MMVVHPPHERAVVAEHALNLRSMGKLELAMNISLVPHRPPFPDAAIDACAVRPQLRSRFHFLEQEMDCIAAMRRGPRNHVVGKLSRAFLLCHEKGHIAKECLVHLHNAFQYMRFLGEMRPESPVPPPYCIIRESGECSRLP